MQYVLAVEVVRQGTYALEPSSYMTPRSLNLGTAEGNFSESQELNAMSSVLLRQWLQFTDREKQASRACAARLAQPVCVRLKPLRPGCGGCSCILVKPQ